MKTLTFLLQAFGFTNFQDLSKSTFGFITNKTLIVGSIASIFTTELSVSLFGVNWAFLSAYVGLILTEWVTGVLASFHRAEKHESRKLGRMLLKVFIYSLLIALLNQMTKIDFKYSFMESFNPFLWLYWVMISIIIWQLWVSVLENLDCLGFRFAKVALKVINKKFENDLKIKDNENSNGTPA